MEQRRSEKDFLFGDCFSACIASILEVDLEEVPVFTAEPYESRDWWQLAVNDWLRLRGYTLVGIEETGMLSFSPECFHIVCGPTDLNGAEGFHAVVAYGDRPVFDPNSSKPKFKRITERWLLVPTDWRHEMTPAVPPWAWERPVVRLLCGYVMYVVGLLVGLLTGIAPGSGP